MIAARSERGLRARDVTFAYRRSPVVIQSIDLSVTPGSITALTGPSGRGKSTLLYLLGLLLTPSSGELEVNGVSTRKLSDAQRSRLRADHFGFVFQDAALDPARSVMDNILEPLLYSAELRPHARQTARELLARFGVDSRAEAKPGQISGGQAQRIALCRALVTKPEILIADEPTGNLDSESAAVVLAAFREQAESGACVIIATHDGTVASASDVVVKL